MVSHEKSTHFPKQFAQFTIKMKTISTHLLLLYKNKNKYMLALINCNENGILFGFVLWLGAVSYDDATARITCSCKCNGQGIAFYVAPLGFCGF